MWHLDEPVLTREQVAQRIERRHVVGRRDTQSGELVDVVLDLGAVAAGVPGVEHPVHLDRAGAMVCDVEPQGSH